MVVPVATYGCRLPAQEWDRFVERTGVPVVMDAAGAFLRQEMPRRCTVAFSFHATKTFGIGEGGLIASDDRELVEAAARLSNFGFRSGRAEMVAGNAKLSEYHAAVGLAQIARLPLLKERHARVLAAYRAQLSPGHIQAGTPGVFAVRVADADAAGERLKFLGIETRRWYQPLLSRHAAYAHVPSAMELEVSAALENRLLGLPFHNFLEEQDIARVCKLLDSEIR